MTHSVLPDTRAVALGLYYLGLEGRREFEQFSLALIKRCRLLSTWSTRLPAVAVCRSAGGTGALVRVRVRTRSASRARAGPVLANLAFLARPLVQSFIAAGPGSVLALVQCSDGVLEHLCRLKITEANTGESVK